MRKSKLLSIAVVALLFLNLSTLGTLLLKEDNHKRFGPPSSDNGSLITEALDFDETKARQFHNLSKEHHQSIRKMERKRVLIKTELYQLLLNKDESKKDSLIQELASLQTTIEDIHYSHFEDIKRLCNEGQLDNFEELIGELPMLFNKPPRK